MMRHVQPNVIIAPVILTQDETTQDGSNRRTLKPMYAQFANVRMPHRNQTWTRVCVGYIRTPNKNQKPKGMSKTEFARRKRALFNAQMDVLLKPLRVYQRTGVLMQLPGRDGETHTSVVVPCAAMCSYDQPEADLVTGKKGAYKMMPMMCSM